MRSLSHSGAMTSTCAPQLRIQGCISSGSETCTCSRQPPSGAAWMCWEGCHWRSSTKGLAAGCKAQDDFAHLIAGHDPPAAGQVCFRVEVRRDGVELVQQLGALQPRQLEGADFARPIVLADDVNARCRRLQGIGGDDPLAQLAAPGRTVGDLDFAPAAPAFGDGFKDGYLAGLCR